MKSTLFAVVSICFALTLSACQLLQNQEDNREARCKEIKNRMMFSTSPLNQTQTFQDRADQGKLNESYHDNDCT